ncbi:hypothetical protein EDB85DRAFT_1899465 [Lactarius pseudohatsudake]|nr:hypothetical protein EDB85DRAFT_1899465 [Lactarius pseudohatsudake]
MAWCRLCHQLCPSALPLTFAPGLRAPLTISPSRGTSGATTKSSGGVSRDREYRRVRGFFLNAIGSLPVRGRTVVLSGQALPPPVHILWVHRLLPMGVPDYLGSGFAIARARENTMGHSLPFFLYAIGSYCTIAHVWENSHVLAIGSVLSRLRDNAHGLSVFISSTAFAGMMRIGSNVSTPSPKSHGSGAILLFIYSLRLVIRRFMSWLYSLSHFATPIQPYCSTVIDFYISSISCLLVINGSVTFCIIAATSSSAAISGVIFSYGLAVLFGVRLPTCAASSTASSFVVSAFCAINSSCRRHFFDLIRYRLITPLLGTYGKDFIWVLLPFTVLCRSSHKLASGSNLPIILSSSRHWVMSTVCPHFWHRGTVTDIQSCTSRGGGHFVTACSVARRSLWSTFRRLMPLAAARFSSGHVTPFKGCQMWKSGVYLFDLLRDFHLHAVPFHEALSVVCDVIGMPVSSSDAWLVSVYVKELYWPATFVCAPCPSVRFDEYRVHSRGVKLSRAFLMPFQLMLAVWHHPCARHALSQDAIGRALCVMDAGITQSVLDARIIGSTLYQLRSTFDGLEVEGFG